MSSQKPLHSGPMLPLAIMALFALMIPFFSIVNSHKSVERTNAMYVPTATPEPVTPTPSATVRPGMMRTY